jgi:hypothetical protein
VDLDGCRATYARPSRTGAFTQEPTSSTFAMKKILPVQPLREHGPHPDEPGILGIILGVVESRVSQLRYFAMRQIHDWLADHHGGLL